jgi:hypothetical protein
MTFYVSQEIFLRFFMPTNKIREGNLVFIIERYCVDKVASVLNKPHHESVRGKRR